MSNDRWVNGYCMATLALFLLVEGTASFGQQLPPEVARWGYADTIFVNGKVVSMDDKSPLPRWEVSTRPSPSRVTES